MTTVVIDHGRANLFSLTHALRHLGERYVVSAEGSVIASATRLVLPGVGAFGDVMKGMLEHELIGPLRDAVARRVPLLGICVGMQILADRSEEFGDHVGLGLVSGAVRRLPEPPPSARGIRVPNIGWRRLQMNDDDPVMCGLGQNTMAYFVHSYGFDVADKSNIAATIDFNGTPVVAAIRQGAIMGYQFHPEKSGPDGLKLIGLFLGLPAAAKDAKPKP